jgi:hypothetical protein
MNEAVPKAEWRQGLNGLQGPWQTQQMVILVDPRDMSFYTYATSAIGGFIAIRELADKVKAMRHWRGAVSPVVTLGDMPMKTRFGERRRPHFNVVDWIRMTGSSESQPALPAPRQSSGTEIVVEAEPAKVMKAESVEAEPAKVEPVKAPIKAEPVMIEAVKAEPVKAEPVKAEPVKAAAKPKRKSKSFALGERVAPLLTAEEMEDEIPFK